MKFIQKSQKWALILMMIVGVEFGYSQGIEFESGTWEELLHKAAQTQKPIFIDVYTTWCRPCKIMSSQIFPLAEVGDVYNSNFICYKIDAEKGEGIQIAKEYDVKSFPTYLFLNADGSLVMKAIGSMPPEDFLALATSAKTELTNPKPIFEWEDEYVQKKTDTAFLRLYMEKRTLLGKSNTELFDEYLLLFPDEKRVSKEIIEIYKREIGNIKINTLAYKNLQDNNAKFSKLGTPAYLFRLSAIKNSLREAITNRDEQLLEKTIEENEKIPKLFRTEQKEEIYMNYYQRVNDMDRYIHYATAYCETWLMNKDVAPVLRDKYSGALNNIAWNFFEKVTDKDALNNALRWSKRSLDIEPDNYMYLDTYANLLYKLGKKNKAIAVQNKTLQLAKKTADEDGIIECEKVLQKMKLGEKTWE